ncbi:hypothetical protein HXX76_002118 [Chlamydomonas incerta]|uniref:tRNA(Ile)-lysidine synthetase n=1 Tax=Chlamydomonas incerta TaxID=51695 RepID=A0A835WAG4_CHLIN|nr:hypothetical protein HXX76_002118 [Chlamydomonas incerta]|eukprot:KAG2443774.1 hypothetical protein HXX76_002118 [Chlamydomonas incerta]
MPHALIEMARSQPALPLHHAWAPAPAVASAPPQAPPAAAQPAAGGPQPAPAHRGVGGRPWTAMHARLQSHLRATGLLDGVDSVLVAVSGGQDSVCLLQLLADLRHLYGWRRLGVVHCDHRWRADSAANAAFVVELATRRLGLPEEEVHVEVAGPGQARCERSAREWRYGVFSRVAAARGYGAVVTAHTSTDRAETMMLNLLRGAGPSGLVALSRDRPLPPPPFSGRAASRPQQESPQAPPPPPRPSSGQLPASGHEQRPEGCGPCGGVGVGGRGASGAAASAAALPTDACTCSSGSCMCGGRGDGTAQAPGDSRSSSSSSSSSRCSTTANGSSSSPAGHDGGAGAGAARLVRPLLQFTRGETLAFLQQTGLPHYHDSTNDVSDHRRNRLRNEVMPLLRAGFNPRLDLALTRFMDVLEPEVEFVEGMAELAYGRVSVREAEAEAGRGPGGAAAAAAAAAAVQARAGATGASCVGSAAGGGAQGEEEDATSSQEALKLPALRKLPLALQRRVLHTWLARELARRRSLKSAADRRARMAVHAASLGDAASGSAAAAAASSKCVEVGFEDVARCLPLVSSAPPQGAVSDQLCGGLVAVVDGEWLRLRAARDLADWQRQVQAQRRQEQQERKRLWLRQVRAARALHGPGQAEELELPPPPKREQQPAAAAGEGSQGLALRYVLTLQRVQQELAELEGLERELLGRLAPPERAGQAISGEPPAARTFHDDIRDRLAALDSVVQLQSMLSTRRAAGGNGNAANQQ